MCNRLHHFETPARCWAVALPFDLDEWIDHWQGLRSAMIREMPDSFARNEWAYLIEFLDPKNLRQPFRESFGEPTLAPGRPIDSMARPRGPVAVWLPNNVSLLGPLTLILLSLTGNPIRMKAGSLADDLTCAFVDYARSRLPASPLATYLTENVQLESFW